MVPDHACVPGLDQPVSVGEYAKLTGLSETQVLTFIHELKIRGAAYFRGQWFVEAPQNCEARLAQLRSDKAETRKEGGLVDWIRGQANERTQSDLQPQCGSRLSELPPRGISEPKSVRATVSQPASDTQEDVGHEAEAQRLRARITSESPRYDSLTDPEKKTLLKITDYAEVPQPVDYGLTYYDVHLRVLGPMGGDLEKPQDGLRYKPQGKWLNFLGAWKFLLAVSFLLYISGFALFVAFYPKIPGGWSWSNQRAIAAFFLGMAVPGFFPGFAVVMPIHLAVSGIVKAITNAYNRSHPNVHLDEYRRARRCYELYLAAKGEAEAAARKAAHDAEMRKRSYWAFLDGYEFERATAEVLRKHQFAAMVTRGSGDGGVDIEVTRNGLKGVVQCKAHINCVGPSVVRDLYGVIHHCGASFGIIVSRGGFTKGAADFARDKPILFLDTDDLIAMQEGKDVLAEAFSSSSPVRS
jgi:hypothetical protein